MAETIGLAIISAITTASVPTAVASVVGQVAITTALVGGSLLIQSLNQPKQRNETQQSVLNQAMGARVVVYGRTMVGGSRYLFETRNGALFQGIIISAREIDRIEAYYIGDRKTVTTLGEEGGIVTDFPQTSTDFAAATAILTLYGSPGQARDFSDDGRPPGTYRYWARARNRSGFGDASSTAGPFDVTVT